ncbi:hypothetical protein [Metabacillus sp. SLBN-84]
MAGAKQTREQLGVQPGDKIILRGRVAFARLDKAVTGEALARENERRAKLGMMKTKEFRSVTIEQPEIVQGEGTPLANFHAQSVYQSKTTGLPTMSFESKSLFAPDYGHMQEDGTILEMADPGKNPAPGQVIYLMVSAFAPKGFNNLGSTFDAIVYDKGAIQFYEGKNSSLAGFGQAMNMPVERMTDGAGTAQPQPQEQVQVAQEQLVGAGVGGGQNQGGFGGFGQAPAGDPNQQQANPNQSGFGGFGQTQTQGQGGFGGFGQQNPGQGAGTSNPFGVQGEAIPNQGSPFGGSGQVGKSPFA